MKQHIEKLIQQSVEHIFQTDNLTLPSPFSVVLERPRELSHGDFSSNVAMTLAKTCQSSPRALAERIKSFLLEHEHLFHVDIAGPGFINFTLSLQQLTDQCEKMWLSHTCGVESIQTTQTVVVDYSSPNLAKEMHIGHLRSTIIGDAIARTLEFKGYHVVRQNHVGDWGTQFGMLLAQVESLEHAQPLDMALHDLESFYKAAKLRFDTDLNFSDRARQLVVQLQSGDEHCLALWSSFIQLSLAHCQAIYTRLGVALTPEDVRAESAYNHSLPEIIHILRDQNLLIEQAGAQCVFLDGFIGKDQEPLPVIVQKKDGGFLYASTDLAAIRYRQHTLHADRILYVVDARQSLHFQQIFALAHRAHFVESTTLLEHISFGMVLDKAGKPFKSRDGGVTKLVDLLDEAERRAQHLIKTKQPDMPDALLQSTARVIGMAAVKYADLSKNRISDYMFDWDSMLSFEGNTAPYLLYAYTRIQRLFEKSNVDKASLHGVFVFEHQDDLKLVKQIILFPDVIDQAMIKSTPHVICTYLYELASTFSSFYEACPVLQQNNIELRHSRLKLAELTARILQKGLFLLGIETLDHM